MPTPSNVCHTHIPTPIRTSEHICRIFTSIVLYACCLLAFALESDCWDGMPRSALIKKSDSGYQGWNALSKSVLVSEGVQNDAQTLVQ